MTFTITHEMLALQEMQKVAEHMGFGTGNSATVSMFREVEEIKRYHEQRDVASAAERIMRTLHELRHRANEHIERFSKQMAVLVRLQRQTQVMRHRGQDGATGKGKGKTSSAKKTAKSASGGSSGSGDGGDGGGDGDGPQRTRSTRRKSRSSKSVTTRPQHLPSSSTGKIVATSPSQVLFHPPLSISRIIIILTVLNFLFDIALAAKSTSIIVIIAFFMLIIALVAMGSHDLAKHFWNSVPKLVKLLAANSDEEGEDSDDES